MLVDLNDPIQVHYLTETALTDSKEFEILSQEEVDDLKKQCLALAQRIDQTRANLVIQSKYRDAAVSMSKLYSPVRTESKRRSLLGNRYSGSENAKEAEAERQASERKCEELAAELWTLEKRLIEPQRRLLQHTAGILQMTHHHSGKKVQPLPSQQPLVHGIPGSPESMYTYTNSRNSYDNAPATEISIDDPYGGSEERLETWSPQKNPPLEIPLRSPVRDQTKELRIETERLRDENDSLKQEENRLREENKSLGQQVASLKTESSHTVRTAQETERKLKDINNRLHDLIVEMSPTTNNSYNAPPQSIRNFTEQDSMPTEMIWNQLDYLEQGIIKIQKDSNTQISETARQIESAIENVNQHLREILTKTDPSYPALPGEASLDEQVEFLQKAVEALEEQLSQVTAISTTGSVEKQKVDQMETVLSELWDIIQRGLADMAQQREKRRCTMREQGVEDDDMSEGEGFDPNEIYTLTAFSSKVQWLFSQTTKLKEQKAILKRQIKQQRELNSKSDAERELEVQRKNEEIIVTKNMLSEAVYETNEIREHLSKVMKELESLQKMKAANEAVASKANQEQLQESGQIIAALEGKAQDFEGKLSQAESSMVELEDKLASAQEAVQTLTSQLAEAVTAREVAENVLLDKEKEVKTREEDLERLNMMVVEIKTELTFAKAELDGAYGTRAERAAEAAALSSNKEMQLLQTRVNQLETELSSTLKEFELITNETIKQEKEKLELENKLDDALLAHTSLETETKELRIRFDKDIGEYHERVTKLQEELDREKLKVQPGQTAARPGAGASMLSEQFRATMREERKKFQEDMKKEVTERRKLEEELRILRKQMGPGRSPLSPRT